MVSVANWRPSRTRKFVNHSVGIGSGFDAHRLDFQGQPNRGSRRWWEMELTGSTVDHVTGVYCNGASRELTGNAIKIDQTAACISFIGLLSINRTVVLETMSALSVPLRRPSISPTTTFTKNKTAVSVSESYGSFYGTDSRATTLPSPPSIPMKPTQSAGPSRRRWRSTTATGNGANTQCVGGVCT